MYLHFVVSRHLELRSQHPDCLARRMNSFLKSVLCSSCFISRIHYPVPLRVVVSHFDDRNVVIHPAAYLRVQRDPLPTEPYP